MLIQLTRNAAALCAVAAFLVLGATPAMSQSILSAPEAQERVATGDMVLLDIRSRQEWTETGVAKGAWPVSMHEPDFSARLQAILNEYPTDQIGLICATGGRTEFIIGVLNKNGITGVSDVSEGMMGNPRGPGWIARGMEVVPLDEAAKSYAAASSAWAN